MKTSYKENDVIFLLKDITGMAAPVSTAEREKYIQQGGHYSEMLPIENLPSEKYLKMYKTALKNYAEKTAHAVCITAEKIYKKKGEHLVLVSLARGGTPIGILIKRYLEQKYNLKNLKHYSISIIKGKGIDKNALAYILKFHSQNEIQFVDGWIGKGAVAEELKKSLENYEEISPEPAVLSDPAGITSLYGTREDILIPNSCLNSIVSGLISRTFFREDIINKNDFHGAVYYSDLVSEDLSYDFINEIEKYFDFNLKEEKSSSSVSANGMNEVLKIKEKYNIENINFIKPGIGETTRVLLRRIPWKILVNPKNADDKSILPLLKLAEEKNISVEYCPLGNYKTCGIIKKLSDI